MKKTLGYASVGLLLCTLTSCGSLSTGKAAESTQQIERHLKRMVKVCTTRPNGSTCTYLRSEELKQMPRNVIIRRPL